MESEELSEMFPPVPRPEVLTVKVEESKLIEVPSRLMLPPLPVPMVSAVMRPVPAKAREADGVPMVMVPPWPPPAAVCSVAALMRELPEKVIARSRGVLALRKMAPAFPLLVALVVSWEPPERLRVLELTKIRPPSPEV